MTPEMPLDEAVGVFWRRLVGVERAEIKEMMRTIALVEKRVAYLKCHAEAVLAQGLPDWAVVNKVGGVLCPHCCETQGPGQYVGLRGEGSIYAVCRCCWKLVAVYLEDGAVQLRRLIWSGGWGAARALAGRWRWRWRTRRAASSF